MAKITTRPNCPVCGSISRMRIRRRWWMRLLPRSMRFRCNDCHTIFIAFR